MAGKSRKIAIYAVLILLIAVFALVYFLEIPTNSSGVEVEGVVLTSTDATVVEHVKAFASNEKFFVSGIVHDPVIEVDGLMFNSIALYLVVLNGNQKEVVQLMRVVDSSNTLLYCLTNKGDLLTEETLGVEECNALIQAEGNAVVLIEIPDNSLQKPKITLSGNKAIIQGNSIGSLNNTSFTLLKAMFSNAEQVLARSNSLTSVLG